MQKLKSGKSGLEVSTYCFTRNLEAASNTNRGFEGMISRWHYFCGRLMKRLVPSMYRDVKYIFPWWCSSTIRFPT